MGSSTSGSFKDLSGGGKLVRARLGEVLEAVDSNLPARIAVGTAVGALAASNPVIAAAVVGYQAAKLSSDAVSAGQSTYTKTGDAGKALQAVGEVVAKGAISVAADQTLSTAADVGWSAIKTASRLVTNPEQDLLITAAVKSTVEEGAKEWLKKGRKS